MDYNILLPPQHLNGLVKFFWDLKSKAGEITAGNYHLMADACPEIIFQYNGGFQNYPVQSARIRFQHSTHASFKVGEKIGFFGVRLHPHAISQLVNIPAAEGVNQVFNWSDLFKQDGCELPDQIYRSIDVFERAALISKFLTKITSRQIIDPVTFLVNKVIKNKGSINIGDLQQESGLSMKQFERRFKTITGFAPKYFARIIRFQAVKDEYCTRQVSSLTNLAYACNYYDQSHFNKEFKEFSGLKPLQCFKVSEAHTPVIQPVSEAHIIETVQRRFDGFLPCGWFI